jgi:hypothetical protein
VCVCVCVFADHHPRVHAPRRARLKDWRKAIKHMIKILHGKPKPVVPKGFPHMKLPADATP